MKDERAVSTTVSYALTLSITTLLVTGLLIAGGDFVTEQRDSATRNELRVLGQQLAADVSAADRLARTAGEDGDIQLTRRLPERVAGSTYRIDVHQVGSSDTYEFTMHSENPDITTESRVYSTYPVFMKSNLTGGSASVSYNSVVEELVVSRPGPFVFGEENGEVVIEAESYPEDHSGSQNASAHFWKAFDDGAASGGRAVVVRPDTAENVNTYDNLYGPRMEYEVQFQTTGTYYVWVRTKADNGEEDSVHVALQEGNGPWEPGTFGGLGLGDDGDGDWDWSNEITDTSQEAQFTVDTTGTHTVSVWMREDGARIDKIVLTTDDSFTPSNDGPAESEWG